MDEVWKCAAVAGIGMLVCQWYDPQHLVVTRHGIGFMEWHQLAPAAVFVAALTSVLTRSALLRPLLAGLALVPIAVLSLFTGLVAFVFAFGGQARADEVARRLFDACDRLLALVPQQQHTPR